MCPHFEHSFVGSCFIGRFYMISKLQSSIISQFGGF